MAASFGIQPASYLDAIAHLPSGASLLLPGVSWEEYERLQEEVGESPDLRIFYDDGKVEVTHTMLDGMKEHKVLPVAHTLMPTQLRIGSVISRGVSGARGEAKVNPEIARVDGAAIVVEQFQSRSVLHAR